MRRPSSSSGKCTVTCLGKPHSENWSKAKVKLARAYEHLKDLRRDLYPQLGKELAEAHCVVMEDTNVKSLVGKSYRE